MYFVTYVDHHGNTITERVPADALDLRENNVARVHGYAIIAMQPTKEGTTP